MDIDLVADYRKNQQDNRKLAQQMARELAEIHKTVDWSSYDGYLESEWESEGIYSGMLDITEMGMRLDRLVVTVKVDISHVNPANPLTHRFLEGLTDDTVAALYEHACQQTETQKHGIDIVDPHAGGDRPLPG